jgi:hypothetical protein
MNQNWNDIAWIFRPDGTLLDIYVQDVDISDWKKLFNLLNDNYKLTFKSFDEEEEVDQIKIKSIINYLEDETGEFEDNILSIFLNDIQINCHFFLAEQIEFDIEPKEINTIDDFLLIYNFMISISKSLKKQVTLTGENSPEFPLIKIDKEKGISEIINQNEIKKIHKEQETFYFKLSIRITKFKMKYFPKMFIREVLKSARKEHASTGKNKNVW